MGRRSRQLAIGSEKLAIKKSFGGNKRLIANFSLQFANWQRSALPPIANC
jgi:hypothetical protein